MYRLGGTAEADKQRQICPPELAKGGEQRKDAKECRESIDAEMVEVTDGVHAEKNGGDPKHYGTR
jgi:hypothetical protein